MMADGDAAIDSGIKNASEPEKWPKFVDEKSSEDADKMEAREAPNPSNASRRKRSLSPRSSEGSTAAAQAAAVSAAAIAAGAQIAMACGTTGLYTLLTTTTSSGLALPASTMPTVEQVRQAATRAVNDSPPHVHLSSRDSAPQLKIEDGAVGRRLVLRGGMRGYRMSRATHGVNEGIYYYEALILPSPTAKDLVARLPPNVRLGKSLQKQLQDQLIREEKQEQEAKRKDEDQEPKAKRRKVSDEEVPPPSVGGHVRIGWSMRTGDLQAPVGYDKWSYGLRDIMGSRCHNSKREDRWGGEAFGEGDVVGFAICLVGSNSKASEKDEAGGAKKSSWTNHIRFFKNGEAMGHFVISKGKREGGAAFDNIENGIYYPAVSAYMGGSVRVNFGPHFVYPPRMLPSGMKVRPVCDLCEAPPSPEEALAKAMKEEKAFNRKTDEAHIKTFRDSILVEAQIRYEAYANHFERHIAEVREARERRNLSTGDLPSNVDEVDEMDVKAT